MSRKTIMVVVAALTAVLTFLKDQFGLAIDPVAVTGGITTALLYVLLEGKIDVKRMQSQAKKFRDPKFWGALIVVIITVLDGSFGWNLPVEPITGIIAAIIAVLFKKEFKKLAVT